MSISRLLCLLLSFLALAPAATSVAQEMNFGAGPQYLLISGSPLFARFLATPTLSFETPLPEANVSAPSENPVPDPAYQQIAAVLDQQRQMALLSIYYGAPTANVIELSFRDEASRAALPPSLRDTGVIEPYDAEGLRMSGYGTTLQEAAGYWKARGTHVARVYTNSDIGNFQK